MRFALASRPSLGRLALAALFIWVLPGFHAWSGLPTAPAEKAKVVGQPVSVQVQPPAVLLTGPRSMQQLIVTGRYADGTVRDLTPFVAIQADAPALLTISDEQMVFPLKNGTTTLVVSAGAQRLLVPVTVRDLDKPQPISFRNDVIAA